jgi:hypothetical protein
MALYITTTGPSAYWAAAYGARACQLPSWPTALKISIRTVVHARAQKSPLSIRSWAVVEDFLDKV